MISEELKQLFASEAVQNITIVTDIPTTGSETVQKTVSGNPDVTINDGTGNPITELLVRVDAEVSSGYPTPQEPVTLSGHSRFNIDVNGTTSSISLGSTVYGGYLNAISNSQGNLVITHNKVVFDGSETWEEVTGGYRTLLPETYQASQTSPINNMFVEGLVKFSSDYKYLIVPKNYTHTLSEWLTCIADNDFVVVLRMATAIQNTISGLSLSTVDGVNTLSADTGRIIRMTYTAHKPYTITNEDIMEGTFYINRTVIEGSTLALGSCIAAELGMTLYNGDGRWNGVPWNGAELTVLLGAEGSEETLPMGVFYVDSTPKTRSTVTITALDGMTKLDKYITNVGWWGPGTTIMSIVSHCCSECGVTLGTSLGNFNNSGWMPNQQIYEGYTYRQLLSFAVAIMGKSAWMDGEGNLIVGFADTLTIPETTAVAGIAIVGSAIVGNSAGSGLVTDTFGMDKRFSSDYEDSAITITGITYTRDDTEYVEGTDEYAFDLTNNPLLDYADYREAQGWVALLQNLSYLIGFKYTPITMTVIPCPYIFPMDWVAYPLSNNTNIYALVTDYTFTLNGVNQIASRGESPEERTKASLNQSVNYIRNVVNATEDFIIASGVSANEGWEARKSGRLECWKNVSTTVNCTDTWGSMYVGETAAITFPSMGNYAFQETPTIIETGQASNGGAWLIPTTTSSLTGTDSHWWGRPTSASNIPVTINIKAIGRWKE